MTWYRGKKSGNTVVDTGDPFETDDELLEQYRREGKKSDETRYIVQLDGENKTAFLVWFSGGKWNREVVWKDSTPPSER